MNLELLKLYNRALREMPNSQQQLKTRKLIKQLKQEQDGNTTD